MIFEQLRITNLFSYQGDVTFDLRPPGDGRNILIVQGRNGQGKTSFLNCIKLLFGGVSDELRYNTGANATPSHNQYVWGAPTLGWDGLLNRAARRAEESEFGIELTAQHGAQRLVIRRDWARAQGGPRSYAGNLNVRVDGRALFENQAQELLHELLPTSLQRFFFYDGELVQSLATLDEAKMSLAITQMLNLSTLNELASRLADTAETWAKAAADHEARAQLAEIDGQLLTLERKHELLADASQRAKEELAQLKARIPSLTRELDALRQRGTNARKQALLARRDETRARIQRAVRALVLEVAPLAPIERVPELTGRAEKRLDEVLSPPISGDTAQDELLQTLIRELPARVFDGHPHCSPALLEPQRAHYKARLLHHLRAYTPDASTLPPPPLLQALSRAQAEVLRVQLRANSAGTSTQSALLRVLQELAEDRASLVQLELEIERLVELTGSEQARYERLLFESEHAHKRQGALEESLPKLGLEVATSSKAITEKRVERERLMQEIRRRQGDQSRAALAARSAAFIQALMGRAKETRRAQIERLMNEHLLELYDSNTLIQRVAISSDFGVSLRGAADRAIAPANLSAGMKQLVATALLWALKDAAGRKVPVIIDTPLARLDLAHQEAILARYLPRASEQVILLPTDAELTPERLKRLAPHVYRHLTLRNKSGEGTRVSEHRDGLGS